MEMSEILARAKELATRYEANGYIHRDATLLLPNLVAECEFWQQKAIEERANQIAGIPVSHLKDKYKRNVYREQAAKELDLQGYVFKTTYDVAGPIEINGERYVKAAYIERLEKEFLAAKGALIWEEIDREQLKEHYKDVDLPWMSAKEKGERIARGAQDALEKIREGT